MRFRIAVVSLLSFSALHAQQSDSKAHLDPAYSPQQLHATGHTPLPEEYIWTTNDAAALRPDHAKFTYRDQEKKTEAHAFRVQFDVRSLPRHAVLFIAGPRGVKAYLNGAPVMDAAADPAAPIHSPVLRTEVKSGFRIGRNVLAVEVVRGRGIVAASDSPLIQQMAFGEVLAVRIEDENTMASPTPLLVSNGQWRSVTAAADGWQTPEFDDGAWPLVQSLGGIESRPEFFQWNLDAGLYQWPGYMGMSPELRTYSLRPAAITRISPKSDSIRNARALLAESTGGLMTASTGNSQPTGTVMPSFLVDFGREVAGRVLIRSACDCTTKVLISYGESESEALSRDHYLGENLLTIPAYGVARGPKSGFRYAWIHVIGGADVIPFRSIEVEGIAYPVKYAGSFVSSDERLNKIWETAAYTAHLCMQDGVWDAPKRDRGWWAGDLDTIEPTTSDVFGDTHPIEQTLAHLAPPAGEHVNGIPSYTALWITTLADAYHHDGEIGALKAHHADLLRLLAQMDAEFDESGNFLNRQHRWLFVDWSAKLFAFTPEAAAGTAMQMLRGYDAGAWMLREMGDDAQARSYGQKAYTLRKQLHSQLEQAADLYRASPQLSALAVLAGIAEPSQFPQIWNDSLGQLGKAGAATPVISPYFNDYLLRAMTRMEHREDALKWLRAYWDGMIDEGATSFWESYDPRWPKDDPHSALDADGRTGHFVSLAHGWSSGPASWLLEEVLGVHAVQPGFRKVVIRPDLLDLQWARGSVATPRGSIGVEVRNDANTHIELTLPRGITATVLVPTRHPNDTVFLNGNAVRSAPAEGGLRAAVVLHAGGHYVITSR